MKAQPLLPPAQWICACGNQEHTQGSHPDGWEWHDTRLLCRDCVCVAAFSFARDESSNLRPAPIRRDGKPDPATSILLRSGAYLDLADPDCTRIEATFEARFAKAFDVRWTDNRHRLIKMADLQALAIEKRDLCPEAIGQDNWPSIASIPPGTIAGVSVGRVWSPDEAEERFLEAFHRVRPSLPQELAA